MNKILDKEAIIKPNENICNIDILLNRLFTDQQAVLQIIQRFSSRFDLKMMHEHAKDLDENKFVLYAIKTEADLFKHIIHTYQDNEEVATLAIEQELHNIQYCSERIRDNKEFIKDYIIREGSLLEYLGNNIKNDKEMVLIAVKSSPVALRYASDTLRNDKEVVLLHVNHTAFDYFGIGDDLAKEMGDLHPRKYLENYFLNQRLQNTLPFKKDNNIKNKI